MERGEHLTSDGLKKIVAFRASMNLGLQKSPKLIAQFPDVVPVPRPKVKNQTIEDYNWLAGFTSAEGCFMVKITANKTNRIGFQVFLVFKLTQHSRDGELMKNLVKLLGCGGLSSKGNAIDLIISNFSNIIDKIIPLFRKYSIYGVKKHDFADFCQVADLMKKKSHLNQEGLDKIRKIKAGMNKGRS